MDTDQKQQTSANNANALMQKALRELRQLKAKVNEFERRAHEPIAVIGIGCRYPGGITNPDQFWQVLQEGRDCITQLTDERWNMDDLYDPDPEAPGKIYTRALGIVDKVDYFDAEFFGISPREIETMDPQHRLLLETAYEAMESSGYAPSSLSGQAIGVFVGISSNDFAHLGSRFGDPAGLTPWSGTGNALCAAPGRISYLFNFTGPSLALDTACSSSLVALHMAVRSLRSGECDGALVGGVNLVLNPGGLIIFSKARMLSEKGACSTFDAGADGYVRAEGCGMIMLKRLSDAERDKDTILGVIRGSAVNQDGKSQGLTAPNELAQERVIRAALSDAQLNGTDVHYVEAHGTGTPLGDPIELAALNTVYGQGRERTQPLLVGSVKTNFGHSEAAAGLAGVIKVLLSFQHKRIPAHLHFSKPNPYIGWDAMAVKVTRDEQDWPVPEQAATAAVSSFGFTGTNAHVILQAYALTETPDSASGKEFLVPISAKNEAGLRAVVSRLREHLANHPETNLATLAYQSAVGKDQHRLRATLQVSSVAQLQQALPQLEEALLQAGQERFSRVKKVPKVAYFCSAHGTVKPEVFATLAARFPAFKTALEQSQQVSGEALFDEQWRWTALAQPKLAQFCFGYALAQLWQVLGVKPSILIGLGVGEFVSATVAELFSLAEAVSLVKAWEQSADSYLQQLANTKLKRPKLKLCASAERDPAKEAYWQALAKADTQFAERVESLHKLNPEIWLEVGCSGARDAENEVASFNSVDALHVCSQIQGQDESAALLHAVSVLYLAGAELNWRALFADKPCALHSLPTYPFQRSRHWSDVIELFQLNHQVPKQAQNWLYQIGWVPKSVWPEQAAAAQTLVIGSKWHLDAVEASFKHQLEKVAFAQLDAHRDSLQAAEINDALCQINPSCLDHFIALLNHFKPSSGHSLKVVYFVDPYFDALSEQERQITVENLPHLQRLLSESLLYLAQAMAYVGHIELTLVTVNGCAVASDARAPDPLQTLAAGFFQTMQVELADAAGVHVDVDHLGPDSLKQILLLAQRPADQLGEQRVAVRAGEAMVPRLRQTQPTQLSNATRSLRKDQTYLIAGGLGSLGLAMAEWMLSKGARQLVLLSRSGEPTDVNDPRVQRIAAMRAKGAVVHAPALDITDAVAMQTLIEEIQASNAPLAGVIHAAGVFDITPIKELSPEHFIRVLDNKVRGLWLLDYLTRDISLQLFVGFSSIASAWSAAGNAHYAAANAFVDGLIQKRRREGKAGLVVNWGPWADSGMVTDASSKLAEKRGLGMMPIEIGLQVLGRLMNSDATQQIVANVDINKLSTVFGVVGKNALFSEIANEVAQPQTVELREEDLKVKQSLIEASEEQRPALLLAYLREQLARALQLEVEAVDETQPLLNIGIDSLMAVEMRNRVRQMLAVDLPITRLLEGANLVELATWLCNAYAEQNRNGVVAEAVSEVAAEDQEVEGVL